MPLIGTDGDAACKVVIALSLNAPVFLFTHTVGGTLLFTSAPNGSVGTADGRSPGAGSYNQLLTGAKPMLPLDQRTVRHVLFPSASQRFGPGPFPAPTFQTRRRRPTLQGEPRPVQGLSTQTRMLWIGTPWGRQTKL